MEINNTNGMQKLYLKAGAILKYFLGTSDKIDTLVMCRNNEVELVTTDQDLYEALGSINDYDKFNQRKLVKFLEVVEIGSLKRVKGKERTILTHAKVEELRKLALKKDD